MSIRGRIARWLPAFLFLTAGSGTGLAADVGIWDRFETSLTNTRTYGDPYRDVTLNVTYTRPCGRTVKFWGFYDGGTTWKIRFMPDKKGMWRYNATFCDGRPGKAGSFAVNMAVGFAAGLAVHYLIFRRVASSPRKKDTRHGSPKGAANAE